MPEITSPARYRGKPVDVEAMQLLDDLRIHHRIAQWITENGGWVHMPLLDPWLVLRTSGGEVRVELGDWVIRDSAGEFYRCPMDDFAAAYERVVDADA